MVEGPDSCFYLTGQASRGEGTGVFGLGHVWQVKLDQHGCLEPGCHLIEDTIDNVVQIIGLQNSLTVFPNPVKDKLYISGIANETLVEVFSVDGRKLSEVVINSDTSLTFNLNNGIYLLKMFSEGKTITKKIVVQ